MINFYYLFLSIFVPFLIVGFILFLIWICCLIEDKDKEKQKEETNKAIMDYIMSDDPKMKWIMDDWKRRSEEAKLTMRYCPLLFQDYDYYEIKTKEQIKFESIKSEHYNFLFLTRLKKVNL